MKLKIEQDSSCLDIEVAVRYARKDARYHRIVSFLQSVDTQLKCYANNTEKMVNISDIYYMESVDKKTFVYLEKLVYRTEFRLYQLLEDLQGYGFVQANKSCILNIGVLDSIKPLLNSRMEATLTNGERICINRSYLSGVKKALEGGGGR